MPKQKGRPAEPIETVSRTKHSEELAYLKARSVFNSLGYLPTQEDIERETYFIKAENAEKEWQASLKDREFKASHFSSACYPPIYRTGGDRTGLRVR